MKLELVHPDPGDIPALYRHDLERSGILREVVTRIREVGSRSYLTDRQDIFADSRDRRNVVSRLCLGIGNCENYALYNDEELEYMNEFCSLFREDGELDNLGKQLVRREYAITPQRSRDSHKSIRVEFASIIDPWIHKLAPIYYKAISLDGDIAQLKDRLNRILAKASDESADMHDELTRVRAEASRHIKDMEVAVSNVALAANHRVFGRQASIHQI